MLTAVNTLTHDNRICCIPIVVYYNLKPSDLLNLIINYYFIYQMIYLYVTK